MAFNSSLSRAGALEIFCRRCHCLLNNLVDPDNLQMNGDFAKISQKLPKGKNKSGMKMYLNTQVEVLSNKRLSPRSWTPVNNTIDRLSVNGSKNSNFMGYHVHFEANPCDFTADGLPGGTS
ncbi:hypothetical protein RUM44_010956 [Polyplax serrata]|uniref:Uncharacterized protein n=1 Tax=Polyplax serrata TaxID=468196 RepID=A0ABR1ANN0_POLSC